MRISTGRNEAVTGLHGLGLDEEPQVGAIDWIEPSQKLDGFCFGRDTGNTIDGIIGVPLPAIVGT